MDIIELEKLPNQATKNEALNSLSSTELASIKESAMRCLKHINRDLRSHKRTLILNFYTVIIGIVGATISGFRFFNIYQLVQLQKLPIDSLAVTSLLIIASISAATYSLVKCFQRKKIIEKFEVELTGFLQIVSHGEESQSQERQTS